MLLPIEALQIILESVQPLGTESLPLTRALNRVTAHPVLAPLSLPPFDNSAMDGYALMAADTLAAHPDMPIRIPVQKTVAAGDLPPLPLPRQVATRIMTGAPLPERADTVLRLEDAVEEAGVLLIRQAISLGDHVRHAGEDIRAGERVLHVGEVLTPAKLGLLAGLGLASVTVFRKPRVAILTTGNELVEPGEPRQRGQIYNSNQYALWAALEASGAEPVLVGTARDEAHATEQLLEAALAHDVVVTSGGVSQGDFDWVGRALDRMGHVHFTQVAQQPGKPMTFATVRGKPVFGLPGNPAATLVAMEIYVRPAIQKMLGRKRPERPRLRAALCEALAPPRGREQYLRARVDYDPDRGFLARLTGPQGSGLQKSLAAANALIVVPADSGALDAGDWVDILLLEGTDDLC